MIYSAAKTATIITTDTTLFFDQYDSITTVEHFLTLKMQIFLCLYSYGDAIKERLLSSHIQFMYIRIENCRQEKNFL